MKQITIIIHTRNEENNIKECIDSAKLLSNNVLVVDMESTDNTITIADKLKATVKSFPEKI